MRTPAGAKNAAKLIGTAISSSTSAPMTVPAPSPRRSTRLSLAKYAYTTTATTATATATTTTSSARIKQEVDDDADNDILLGSDIEDAVVPRKRRRVDIAAATTRTRRRVVKTGNTTIKTEIKTEDDVIKTEEDLIKTEDGVVKTEDGVTKAEEEEDSIKTEDGVKPGRKVRKPARTVVDSDTGETKVAPPSDWEEIYELIREMRAPGGAAYGAPVDTMGCERLADRTASPRDQRFQTLIALMLSSQTKDTVNAVVMQQLKTELPAWKEGEKKGLCLENILAVDQEELNQMIWTVGFHNNKAKYIKQAAVILRDKFKGDIPDTIEGLVSLPGVGPKMAHLCMSAAWNRTQGIGVDVHVHRITNLWGWNGVKPTRNPEETRIALQSWLPRDRWREINGLLVGLGQAVCLPIGRRCGDCKVGLEGLCRAADRKKIADAKKRDS